MQFTRASFVVRCRACCCEYAKPDARSTARANPGCPECGALGWMPILHPVTDLETEPRRFDAGPRQPRAVREG